MSHREFARGVQRRARVRAVAAVLACLAVVAAVAVGVACSRWFGTLDGKLALKTPTRPRRWCPQARRRRVLRGGGREPGRERAYRRGARARRCGVEGRGGGVASRRLAGGLRRRRGPHPEETAASGDAALIGAVASFAGVDVSHYVELDAQGLADLVDGLGGVEVEVAEEGGRPRRRRRGTFPQGPKRSTAPRRWCWPAPPTSRTAWKRRPRTSARCSRPCRFVFWATTRWAFCPHRQSGRHVWD